MGIEQELRESVRGLFAEKKIDLFIGYRTGTLPSRTRPCFITGEDEVEKLVWNDHCLNNLSVYLPRYFSFPLLSSPTGGGRKGGGGGEELKLPRIGIVAKACDARSLVGLIKERQVPRENVAIVGVACEGMKDGTEPAKACLDCTHPVPKVYDVLLGGSKEKKAKRDSFGKVKEFESKPAQERWEYFNQEISKCIRCYACRQACPNCYCKECFADQTRPKWIGASSDMSDVMVYHLIRAFHQAGRCVDCGACSRACPMGVDVRFLTKKLEKDVKDIYGYEAGLSLEEACPLATFSSQDPREFITEPK